jgi:myo-inositol-1(or 4)-monophosphatase
MKEKDIQHLLPPEDYSPELLAGVNAALAAGELLRKGFGTDFSIATKDVKNDLVTTYDHASEDLIISLLRSKYPHFSFLCEESGHQKHADSEYCWVIDPLDGTVNFAHNLPIFCVSIALVKGDNVICGIIYEPNTQELFVAEKSLGAFLNGKRIRVSENNALDQAFISTSLSFNLHKNPRASISKFGEMAYCGFPLRAIGSTALNLAFIAAGRFDAYWSLSGSVCPWDIAAGKLLVEEAGGKITQCDGSPYHLFEQSNVLATNSQLHVAAQDLLQASLTIEPNQGDPR